MRYATAIAVLGLGLIVGACGDNDDLTPAACLEGADTYLRALEEAPGEVRLDGETAISECLAENQSGGDLAAVGAAMLETTTELSAAARTDPGGGANLQLGYLIGAAERGAGGTEGIHADLIRRLTAAARYSPRARPPTATFLATYREGFDAGRAGG